MSQKSSYNESLVSKIKRLNNLYTKICDFENIKIAHRNASRGKHWYKEVKMVNSDPEKYLTELQNQLINKTYKTSEYEIFTRDDGVKKREIYKLPYYPDRIVHWAILQVIEPILLKNLITNTYSAIPNRGIHYGMQRVKSDIYNDPEGCKYCLKLDIRKYYPSINHEILKQKYRRLFKDKDLLWLLDEIVDSVNENEGVPIGNYLSQYFGNFYLSSFDHWIKEEKHVKYYHRYMDDMVIFGGSKEELHQLFDDIQEYVSKELKLHIKDNWQIFPTQVRGVDFLGYRFFGKYTLVRKRTYKNMKRKMIQYAKYDTLNYNQKCSVVSYEGWLMHCDAHRLRKKYVEPIITKPSFKRNEMRFGKVKKAKNNKGVMK